MGYSPRSLSSLVALTRGYVHRPRCDLCKAPPGGRRPLLTFWRKRDFSAELDAALKPRRALALARGRALAATPASLRWPFQFPRLWRFGGSRGTNRRATHCQG